MIKSVKSTHTHTHSKLITTHTHALDERVAVAAAAAEAAVVVVGVSADFDAAPPLRPPAVATLTAAAGVLLSTVNRKANGRRALLNTRHPEGTTPVTTTFGM